MKKLYISPDVELLAFCSLSPIGTEMESGGEWLEEEEVNNSKPWNDGELGGWT